MDGIISLEMTPDWQSPDVRTRLATCLTKASSLIIRMADSSSLFSGAVQYLEEIKRICQPFDLSRVEFYKQLQRKQAEDTVAAIEIEAADADLLQGLAVTVFGTDPEELKQVGALRDVYISAFEESGHGEYIYRATVMASGLMASHAAPAAGLSFAARRYAFRHGRRFPKLLPTSEVSTDVLRDAAYFVMLDNQKYERDLQAFDPPSRTDSWEEVQPVASPLLARLTDEQKRTLFRSKAAVVRTPAEPDKATPTVAEISERRALAEHGLIVRKVLRPRR